MLKKQLKKLLKFQVNNLIQINDDIVLIYYNLFNIIN